MGARYASRTDEQLLDDARWEHTRKGAEPRFPVPGCAAMADESLSAVTGFPVVAVTPAGAAPPSPGPRRVGGPVVLYLHGGAYTNGFRRWHWRFIGRVAAAAGATIYAPDYPLAPEHTWRDAYGPIVDLAEAIAERHDRLPTIAGDSAGAGLALGVAQSLVTRGHRPDVAAIAPWTDLTGRVVPLSAERSGDRWLTLGRLHACARAWAGGDALDRPEVSPAFGTVHGLRQLLLICGTNDLLHPQSIHLAERARTTGVDVELIEGTGLPHVYPLLPIPEAR